MPVPNPVIADCPMCGSVNKFARSDLTDIAEDVWGTEPKKQMRGHCRTCGEAIDVQVPAGPAKKARRTEALIAFFVLAAVVAIFIVSVLAMHAQ